jgi:hypothetical protein
VLAQEPPRLSKDRSHISYKIRYAVSHPRDIRQYASRWVRNLWLGLRADSHVAYYRSVMRSNVARGAEIAVGGSTHESWLRLGQVQFDYLLRHGLDPGMRVLELGCGNLRAGRLLID